MFRIILIFIIFTLSMYANTNIKHSTYWITKSHYIGKNYAFIITNMIPNYKDFSNGLLCNKFIIHDLQEKNENKYFYSNYLIKNFNEEFTMKVFISCIDNINQFKKRK